MGLSRTKYGEGRIKDPRTKLRDSPKFSAYVQKKKRMKDAKFMKLTKLNNIQCHKTPDEKTVLRTGNGRVEVITAKCF